MKPTATLAVFLFLPSAFAFAQTQSPNPAGPRPQFEVATIKPNTSGTRMVRIMMAPDGRLNAENVTLRMLINFGYDIRSDQVSGAPSWAGSDRYDVVGKAETRVPPDQIRLMVQSLLADRFKFTFHRETKDLPVYDLLPAKGGLKLIANTESSCLKIDPEHPPPPPTPGGPMPKICGNIGVGRGQFNAWGIPIARLVEGLSTLLERTVIDKTGATGTYDIHLEYTPDQAAMGSPFGPPGPGGPADAPPPDSASPNIFTALQEQLGLKAEPAKGRVEVLVIDHVERPSEN